MKALLNFFSSIRLTVTLLAFSTVLVFFGTLDQADYGIHYTQKKYFESFFALWEYNPWMPKGETLNPYIKLPLPGGYLLGPLLVVNLLAAHFRYFRRRWDKAGIVFIHVGVVMLLVGQMLTQMMQKEYFLWLDEGGQGNYIESFRENELAIIDKSDPAKDTVVAIPASRIARGETRFQHPALPFVVEIIGYSENAVVMPRNQAGAQAPPMPFDRGIGAQRDLVVFSTDLATEPNSRNLPAAFVRLTTPEGPIGTWLTWAFFRQRMGDGSLSNIPVAQTFEYQGKTYEIAMRYTREYLPAQIELLDFTHDRYPGTEIPRNFASRVRIHETDTGEGRESLIYMNHPLRYAGFTFYQASFGQQDTASMFQVVRNPSRWLPYIASITISLGLLVQFVLSLGKHVRRSRA